jgi:zinc D-Ala-D-Ala carboxypeptidase
MQLSPNFALEQFTRSEAAIKKGILNTPLPEHLKNLTHLAKCMEEVLALFGSKIQITSGYRNPDVNDLVGGTKTSAHCLGHAADFHVEGLSDLEAAKKIRDSGLKFDQLIFEKGRCVHISFDPRLRGQVKRQPGGPNTKTFPGLEG